MDPFTGHAPRFVLLFVRKPDLAPRGHVCVVTKQGRRGNPPDGPPVKRASIPCTIAPQGGCDGLVVLIEGRGPWRQAGHLCDKGS